MLKIDSHQHFWQYRPERDTWITGAMQVLQQDFKPADLKPLLQSEGISGCIAVQADQSEAENSFLLSCAQQHDYIKGIIAWTDLRSEQLEERLIHYRKSGLVKGFRHILQSETDRALMLRPAFMQGISLLGKYHFTYDILIYPDQLLFARELALCFPQQTFILDHIGKPAISKGSDPDWEEHINLLGACKNVYCKISGTVTEALPGTPSVAVLLPYIQTAIQAFGTERILFGSDWPVCLLAGSYHNVCRLAEEAMAPYTLQEQQAFWAGNAITCYNLDLKHENHGPATKR